jgi:hypothetical protein
MKGVEKGDIGKGEKSLADLIMQKLETGDFEEGDKLD